MMTRLLAAVVVAVVAVTPAAFAQTYIVPETDCGEVTLHAASGTDFPRLVKTVDAQSVTRAFVFLPKQRVGLKPVAGAQSLDFKADVPDTNVVMVAADFAPTIYGNETQTDHAKAFIRCGAIAKGDDWQRSTGIGLEIYPQWNGQPPLKPGASMDFILIDATGKRDQLVRDVPMDLYLAGAGRVAAGAPDQYGHVKFPYKEPGRYMVVATYRRPDPNNANQLLVDTSTLTFEMK